MRESQDVGQAKQRLAAAQAELAEIEQQMAADVAGADAAARPESETLEEVRLAPREVEVESVSLLWRRA